jgi:hypothetical protein
MPCVWVKSCAGIRHRVFASFRTLILLAVRYVVRDGRGTVMTRVNRGDAESAACICWESQGNLAVEEVVRM